MSNQQIPSSRGILRKSFFYIFSKLLPEIKILRKNISWAEHEDFSCGCTLSSTCKIAPPYNLQKVTIGDYSYLSRNSFASHLKIGKFCSIGPNFFAGWGIHPVDGLSTSPSFYSKNSPCFSFSSENKIVERKEINIGNDVYIGANVTVLDGVSIGDGAIIGAGALVSKNIPPYAIAVGSPIKIIRYRFEEDQIKKLLRIKWWDFNEHQLRDVESMFYKIDEFISRYE